MPLDLYLKHKYGFTDTAETPIEFIAEELFIEMAEVKALVRTALKRKSCPVMIKFREFRQIVQEVLE